MGPHFKNYLLLSIAFLVLNLGLGSWGITETSEARYAEISREMLLSGDYLHPTLLGIKHYHKPPLTYYITTLGYQLFGINEYGARFFLSVALLIQLILVYKIARLLFNDKKRSFAAAVIYFSFPLVLAASRVLTTDTYLLTFVLWSIYNLLYYKKQGSVVHLYGFFVVFALGLLTKGPAALIPVAGFLMVWHLLYKERFALGWHHMFGGLLFLLLGGSWFFAMLLDDPAFGSYFLKEQILDRAIAANDLNRNKPIWYYLLLLPLAGFPWLPIIAVNAVAGYKKHIKNSLVPKTLLYIAVFIFLAFSFISSKLIFYILPIFPFIAILGAYLLYKSPLRRISILTSVYIGLIILFISALLAVNFIPAINFNWRLSAALSIMLCVGGYLALRFYPPQSITRLLYLSMLLALGWVLTFPLYSSRNASSIKTIKTVIATAKERKTGAIGPFIVYNVWIPSTAFYLQKDVITIRDDVKRITRETQFEEDSLYKRNLIDIREPSELLRLRQLFRGEESMLLVLKKDILPAAIAQEVKRYKHREEIDKFHLYY